MEGQDNRREVQGLWREGQDNWREGQDNWRKGQDNWRGRSRQPKGKVMTTEWKVKTTGGKILLKWKINFDQNNQIRMAEICIFLFSYYLKYSRDFLQILLMDNGLGCGELHPAPNQIHLFKTGLRIWIRLGQTWIIFTRSGSGSYQYFGNVKLNKHGKSILKIELLHIFRWLFPFLQLKKTSFKYQKKYVG